MTDKEIIDFCRSILQKNSYISVAWQLKHALNLDANEGMIRRIRAKLLEMPQYIEDSEREKEGGYFRIRKKNISIKERYPLVYDLVVGATGGLIVLLATTWLSTKEQPADRQQLQELNLEMEKVNHRIDSVKNLPIFQVDSPQHK
jgi:hypothetical protein